MIKPLLPLRACSAVVALAAAVSVLAAPQVDANGYVSAYVSCYDGRETAAVPGSFSEAGSGQETRFLLAPDADRGCTVRHEGGDAVNVGNIWTGAHLAGVCRDSETGRDHAILHASAGQHSDVQIWAVDPATGSAVMLHSEAWVDSLYPSGQEWGLNFLIAADGACHWRERQDAHQSFKAAMAALRIGADLEVDGSEFDLPTRPVPAETVRRWLPVLKNAATLEGAVYADEAGREAWLVVQVLGRTLCDAEGLVLLFDRQRKSWMTIYDVPSGCSKTLNFPMRRMVVKGDRLFASICWSCSGWGYYRDHVIDLRSFHATSLDPGDGPELPKDHENPVIRELADSAFLQTGL